MASIDEIIGYYQETGNFMKTAAKFKMNKLILHLTLTKARVLKINDKIDYGSTNIRFGGLAEKKFNEIFPEAISTNDYWVRNHPDYDFDLKKLRIDVKYSSIHIRKTGNEEWCAHGNRTKHKQENPVDFFVVFLEREKGSKLDNPYILAIPGGMAKSEIHISKSGMFFNEFRMKDESELREYLLAYADLV